MFKNFKKIILNYKTNKPCHCERCETERSNPVFIAKTSGLLRRSRWSLLAMTILDQFSHPKKVIKLSQYFFCVIILLLISFNLIFAISDEELTRLKTTQFGLKSLAGEIGFQTGKTATPSQMLGQIIGTALSLLGIIFMILIIYSGFTWMTARGDNEKVNNAKDTMINAAIGAIVVFGAYAISSYIIDVLAKAT